jgi:hypothetical protein
MRLSREQEAVMPTPQSPVAAKLASFLYTHNPFYLIGTLLVLFGVQQCLGQQPTLATSGLLVMALCLYTLLLAGVAAIVIRIGQIWDDARTILLVIVLLFFMLSTSLDFHLLFTLEEPWPGTYMLAGGLFFAVLLSEALLRGLRIGLAWSYRLPYYLVLVLLFGYPVLLGWMNYYSYYAELKWALFAFPAVGAVALLTLLPAARTPPWQEPKSGTPWRWPFYPWSLHLFLTIGLAIRAWWLTIAFEPAKGLDAYFRPYFLLPLVIAWAVLLLEMGLARRLQATVAAAIMLPIAGLVLGFPGPGRNLVETAFLSQLIEAVGSPPQLTVAGLLTFYGYAWLRGVRAAEGFVTGSALLAAFVGPQTLDWTTLTPPNPLPVAAVAGTFIGLAIHRQSTWRAVLGCGLIVAGLEFVGGKLGGASFWFWQLHALPLALLTITAVFDDALARSLRQLAWPLVPAMGISAAVVYPWTMPEADPAAMAGYLALLVVLSAAFWLRERRIELLIGILATLAASFLEQTRQVYTVLEQSALAGGLPWLATGLGIVAGAFIISLFKMGIWPRIWRWLQQINAALGGTRPAPA